MNRRPTPFTVLQASQNHPHLGRLMDLQRASQERLRAIAPLIPSALLGNVQAGPIDDGVWCLLLANNTTAAKLRQLLPALEAHLRVQELAVKAIRLKVQRPG